MSRSRGGREDYFSTGRTEAMTLAAIVPTLNDERSSLAALIA